MIQLVTPAQVRTYLASVSVTSSEQYSDETIGSNILAAQSNLETMLGRYIAPRTFDAVPWKMTSMLRWQVPIPGFRTFTQVQWGGSVLVPDAVDPLNPSCWVFPDSQQSGVYTSMAFRAARADASGRPWWIADPGWFDKALDSPFYPGNYGGGYFYSSMPNDLRITGEAGWADAASTPFAILHAIKILAAFYTLRGPSILTDVAITAQGGILNYSQMPGEVQQVIRDWRGEGRNYMVSVGG
jgi:hypothetical protein